MAGASVTETAELVCFSRGTISMTMTEFKKIRKIFSKQSNSGRISNLTNRDRRAFERIVGRKHQTTAAKAIVSSTSM